MKFIYGRQRNVKPPLAPKPPTCITEVTTGTRPTTFKLRTFEQSILGGKSYSAGLSEDYLEVLYNTFQSLEVILKHGEATTNDELEKVIFRKIESFLPSRNEFIDFVCLICKYGSDVRYWEALRRFFINAAPLVGRDYKPNVGDVYPDDFGFLIPELFLYTIAALVKYDQFEDVNIFLGTAYPSTIDADRVGMRNFAVFTPYMKNIEDWYRYKRSSRGYREYTPTLRLLKERATHQNVSAHVQGNRMKE